MKFLTNINLNKNEIQNVVIQNLATAPSSPKEGQPYYNSVDKKLYVYNGTTWVDATSLGIIYSWGDGLTNTENTITLNIATSSALGGVKIGTNINVDAGGIISVNSASTSQKGLVELATDAEVVTGTSETLVTNVKQLAGKLKIAQGIGNASKFVKTDANGDINTFGAIETGDIPDLSGAYQAKSQLLTAFQDTPDNEHYIAEKLAKDSLDNKVDKNAAITANTTKYNFPTYDTKGLVSGVVAEAKQKTTKINGTTHTVYGTTGTATADIYAPITSGTTGQILKATTGGAPAWGSLGTGDIPDLSGTYIPLSQKGAVNGVATLGADGLIPSTQLPSYVDDIIDLLTLSGTAPATATTGDKYYNTTSKLIFTATGTNTWGGTGATPEAGKIYVAIDTNLSYRWSGSDLVEISSATIHKYVGTITGNDSTTSFTITHGLNTRDAIVSVYTNASPYDEVFVDIEMTSTTAITVKFAAAPATGTNYRVVIIA